MTFCPFVDKEKQFFLVLLSPSIESKGRPLIMPLKYLRRDCSIRPGMTSAGYKWKHNFCIPSAIKGCDSSLL